MATQGRLVVVGGAPLSHAARRTTSPTSRDWVKHPVHDTAANFLRQKQLFVPETISCNLPVTASCFLGMKNVSTFGSIGVLENQEQRAPPAARAPSAARTIPLRIGHAELQGTPEPALPRPCARSPQVRARSTGSHGANAQRGTSPPHLHARMHICTSTLAHMRNGRGERKRSHLPCCGSSVGGFCEVARARARARAHAFRKGAWLQQAHLGWFLWLVWF